MPNKLGLRQVVCQLKNKKEKFAQGKQNLRAVCLEGKLEFTVFFFQACKDILFGRCAVAFLGKMLNKPLIYEIEIKVKDHTPTMKRLKCLNDNSHKGRSLTSYG